MESDDSISIGIVKLTDNLYRLGYSNKTLIELIKPYKLGSISRLA